MLIFTFNLLRPFRNFADTSWMKLRYSFNLFVFWQILQLKKEDNWRKHSTSFLINIWTNLLAFMKCVIKHCLYGSSNIYEVHASFLFAFNWKKGNENCQYTSFVYLDLKGTVERKFWPLGFFTGPTLSNNSKKRLGCLVVTWVKKILKSLICNNHIKIKLRSPVSISKKVETISTYEQQCVVIMFVDTIFFAYTEAVNTLFCM